MNIFNSLGSNYNLKFVLSSLFANGSDKDRQDLIHLLEKKYNGKAILLYKGREALTLAIKTLNLPPKTEAAINGFTCFAVYKAIEKAGYKPVCLDLDSDKFDLNFSTSVLEAEVKKNPNLKVVIVQNTLGYPCDIEGILEICKKKNLVLIEDLAHCVGTKYSNGKEAGTVGPIAVLSFSQDKVIDAVSGGALIIRERTLASQGEALQSKKINFRQQLKDKFYPILTYKIRTFYSFGLGKLLHFLLKKLDLLSKPMEENLYELLSLPNWYCYLAMIGFNNLSQNLNHRRRIAQIYIDNLNKSAQSKEIAQNLDLSSNLRFPIFVEKRAQLLEYLKDYGIHVSDIWYEDVSPDCPNAQKVSRKVLNLPTHINVSERDARLICERINELIQ
ncbi:MAG: DegT/DnrJ/EryC1/StrS aminotransferase family protein [Candidatus Levybacteria bacterium]|nr:DegT/DnrJ/EryC1/StrS aminotransferase family protein [Candidatus Levybacteria bacterium]